MTERDGVEDPDDGSADQQDEAEEGQPAPEAEDAEQPDAADPPAENDDPAGSSSGDTAPGLLPLQGAQFRAFQDALRAARSLPIADMQRALRNLPRFNEEYLEAARKAALAMPPLDVTVRLPKPTLDAALLGMNRELSERMARLGRDFSVAVSPTALPGMRELAERVQRSLRIDPELLTSLREAAERRMPENVRGIQVKDLLALVSLAATHRLGVFYAIRPERVRQVLDAGDDAAAIDAVLDEFADEDFHFVEGVLGKVIEADPRLGGLAALLMESVSALRSGLPAASQALSTNVWDTEISRAAGKGGKAITYARGLARGAEQLLQEGLFELFESGIHAPLVTAYITPNDSELYSRNGTIHDAQPKQFSKANAVRALTIAVSLIAWRALHGRE